MVSKGVLPTRLSKTIRRIMTFRQNSPKKATLFLHHRTFTCLPTVFGLCNAKAIRSVKLSFQRSLLSMSKLCVGWLVVLKSIRIESHSTDYPMAERAPCGFLPLCPSTACRFAQQTSMIGFGRTRAHPPPTVMYGRWSMRSLNSILGANLTMLRWQH